jgi:hypothetical protein
MLALVWRKTKRSKLEFGNKIIEEHHLDVFLKACSCYEIREKTNQMNFQSCLIFQIKFSQYFAIVWKQMTIGPQLGHRLKKNY